MVLYFLMVPGSVGARKLAAIALMLVAAAPFAGFSLLQNRAVTGRWTTLPYMLSREQYGVPAAFTFQANPVPQRALTPEQELDYRAQSSLHGDGADTLARFISRLGERIVVYRFFFYPPLYLALIAFLASLREPRFRWVLTTVLLFVAGTNFYPYFYPHYVAALACVFVLLSVAGLRELGKTRVGGRRIGPEAIRMILLLYAGWFLFLYMSQLVGNERWLTAIANYDTAHFINWGDPEGRAAVNRQLSRMVGDQLVFVHYAPGHGFHEWIHNAADIDRAKVVWALDLGDHENRELTRYYPRRSAWLIEPDVWPPRLTPYQPPYQPKLEPLNSSPPLQQSPPRTPASDAIQTLPESGFLKHQR